MTSKFGTPIAFKVFGLNAKIFARSVQSAMFLSAHTDAAVEILEANPHACVPSRISDAHTCNHILLFNN